MKVFHKRSDIYCGSSKIFSSGPKRLLETQTFKKKTTSPVKRFWPISSRIIECVEPNGTIYMGPQFILTFAVEVTRSFL